MNKNLTRYYPSGNDFVAIPTPDGKQTEENPANKAIECRVCSRMATQYARVIRFIDEDNAVIMGVCCYTCAYTLRLKPSIILIDKDNNTFTHDSIPMASQLPRGVGYNDGTKDAFEDRDKYRRSIIKMRDINKRLGILMPTFKQEQNKTLRVRKNPLNYLTDEQKRVIVEKIKRGEIKID